MFCLGFKDLGLGFLVYRLGFAALGLKGCRDRDLKCADQGLGCGAMDLSFRICC